MKKTERPYGYEPAESVMVPQKPKKRFYKRVWFWILVVAVGATVGIVASITGAANEALNSDHTITYRVDNNAPRGSKILYSDITYSIYDVSTNSVKTVNVNKVALPWTKTVQGKGTASGYVVTATSTDLYGNMECSLTIDGKVVSSDTGGTTIASCLG